MLSKERHQTVTGPPALVEVVSHSSFGVECVAKKVASKALRVTQATSIRGFAYDRQ